MVVFEFIMENLLWKIQNPSLQRQCGGGKGVFGLLDQNTLQFW